jgi:hypothetical protein
MRILVPEPPKLILQKFAMQFPTCSQRLNLSGMMSGSSRLGLACHCIQRHLDSKPNTSQVNLNSARGILRRFNRQKDYLELIAIARMIATAKIRSIAPMKDLVSHAGLWGLGSSPRPSANGAGSGSPQSCEDADIVRDK